MITLEKQPGIVMLIGENTGMPRFTFIPTALKTVCQKRGIGQPFPAYAIPADCHGQ